MLYKAAKPQAWKFIKKSAKILFVAEALCFAGSYAVWHFMNTKSEFRYYMSKNYPLVLEGYYWFGEKVSDSKIRQVDLAVWAATKAKSE